MIHSFVRMAHCPTETDRKMGREVDIVWMGMTANNSKSVVVFPQDAARLTQFSSSIKTKTGCLVDGQIQSLRQSVNLSICWFIVSDDRTGR